MEIAGMYSICISCIVSECVIFDMHLPFAEYAGKHTCLPVYNFTLLQANKFWLGCELLPTESFPAGKRQTIEDFWWIYTPLVIKHG